MFKLDLEPLALRLLQNREAHIEYLKYTQEQAYIIWGLVKQAKAKQQLDKELDFACKHAQRIQELLVYVRDTCPNAINLSAKKVVVIPKTNIKKVRFAKPLTSSSNIKHVESSKTSDSNTPVLSPIGLNCSISNYGSKPTCNKKNDRISRTPRFADVLAERDATRSRNGDDSLDSGTGGRRQTLPTRECTYSDFLKCQPLNFKGTEGVVGLTQWFEKMESVFHISNYTVAYQIKFASCTLQGIALTWWNSHVKTVTHEVVYAMTWKTLKKMMTDKYCPRGEIKKLEIKIYDREVCRWFAHMIHGSVMASKPKTMQDAIEFSTELMDKKISTLAERQAENKRKLDNNNQSQQQPPKKQGVAIAYTVEPGERKEYAGTLPLCNKFKFHHNGQCTVKCANCKRVGHLTRDYRSPATTNNQKNLTCYECGNQGHYRSDCPELKNQNHRNQARGTKARGMVHTLGGGETN
ncbi:hypothetical protein Tco_1531423 [Tanacetum coccineum]